MIKKIPPYSFVASQQASWLDSWDLVPYVGYKREFISLFGLSLPGVNIVAGFFVGTTYPLQVFFYSWGFNKGPAGLVGRVASHCSLFYSRLSSPLHFSFILAVNVDGLQNGVVNIVLQVIIKIINF